MGRGPEEGGGLGVTSRGEGAWGAVAASPPKTCDVSKPTGVAASPPETCVVPKPTHGVLLQDLFQHRGASELHESPLRTQANSDISMNGTVWSMRRGKGCNIERRARCSVTDLRHVGVTGGLLLASTY